MLLELHSSARKGSRWKVVSVAGIAFPGPRGPGVQADRQYPTDFIGRLGFVVSEFFCMQQ